MTKFKYVRLSRPGETDPDTVAVYTGFGFVEFEPDANLTEALGGVAVPQLLETEVAPTEPTSANHESSPEDLTQ